MLRTQYTEPGTQNVVLMKRLLTYPPITWGLLLLPVVGFFAYFFYLSYDIPWFDEYENIPFFLQRFLDAQTLQEKWEALLRPNNEHRVLYARLVVYGQYLLTGGISFSGLMWWGNMGLVVILVLLYRTVRELQLPVAYLLPVPLMLFTAQNYLLTFTAIYTLQYLAIIMLVMVTFFVLAQHRLVYFWGALLLGMLATFSMGNGLLLWPAGAVMLFAQRRWARLGIWLAIGGLSIYLYFLGYPVQQGNAEGFAYVLKHPLQTVAGFLIFAGSIFDLVPAWPVEKRVYLPFLAGLVIVGFLVYWLVKIVFRKERNTSMVEVFLLGCVLFLLANMGLIALFRIRFYFGMVLHSSYRTYSLVLWAVAYVAFLQTQAQSIQVRKTKVIYWLPAIWLLFVFVNGFTYFTYLPEAIQRRLHMQGLTFNQRFNAIGLGGTRNSALAKWITELTDLMQQRGWYELPKPSIVADEEKVLASARDSVRVDRLIIEQKPDYVVVSSDEPGYQVDRSTGLYLVIKSAQHTYLMFAEPNEPKSWHPFRVMPGWSAAMPKALVQPGEYQLGLLKVANGQSSIQFTDKRVVID